MHPGKVENALRKGVTAEKFFTQTILRFVPFGREYLVYGCFVGVKLIYFRLILTVSFREAKQSLAIQI